MKLKPFAEMLAMTKEGVDKALAPIRARQVRIQAELEQSKLDENIVTLETEVQEMCVGKSIDFELLLSKLDKIALMERRKKQYAQVLRELFP
jgi:GTP-binding protein EngB required for normal cell division